MLEIPRLVRKNICRKGDLVEPGLDCSAARMQREQVAYAGNPKYRGCYATNPAKQLLIDL